MASSKKSRVANRRPSKLNEESPDKNEGISNKNKRKRKLSDMLGSPWSKEDLERFYIAYRKYGKDWKKVAGAVRHRSVDMVEALYNMNKAYLSLPEGTASVAGLIAMMTDHRNILEGSDSDQESNDGVPATQKSQNRSRGHSKLNNMSKDFSKSLPDLLRHQSAASNNGCLSLLKKKRSGGNWSRAVGKRTPRFPVSYSHGYTDFGRNGKRNLRREVDSEDFDVARAALALAEASQRVGPPASAPSKRVTSSIMNGQRKVEEEPVSDRIRGATAEEDYYDDSLGSRGVENGEFSKDRGGIRAVYRSRKEKKNFVKNPMSVDYGNNVHVNDVREACSGTEEGLAYKATEDEIEAEVTNKKKYRQSSQFSNRRSKLIFSGDESTAVDALQALADVPLNILTPISPAESESSVQVKEEIENANADEKPYSSVVVSTRTKRDKAKGLEKKDKLYCAPESVASKKVKNRKSYDANPVFEFNRLCELSAGKSWKRKRKSSSGKSSEIETDREPPLMEPFKFELLKQGKSSKGKEHPFSTELDSRTDVGLGESVLQISSINLVNLPAKRISRRKLHLKRVLAQKRRGPLDVTGVETADKWLHMPDRAADIKNELIHGLSSPLLHRWCAFEWFYSAIDFPWFAKNEFVEYLNHAKLGTLPPKLTRAEWGVIRSALGKPRRFSEQLLQEERKKLEEYREHVRATYAELRAGIQEGLPTDLARPLSVGQRVIAWHPKTRELRDGSVLTVDRNKCRIQFDKRELGVELVMDIDCMPSDPLENLPKALRMQNFAFKRLHDIYGKMNVDNQLIEWRNGNFAKDAPSETLQALGNLATVPIPNFNTLMRQAKGTTLDAVLQAKAAINNVVATQAAYGPCQTLAQIQARDADNKALMDLFYAVDKKEALLAEVKGLHEDASFSLNQRGSYRDCNSQIDRQLKIVDGQISSALELLRDNNMFDKIGISPSVSRPDNNVGSISRNSALIGHSAFFNKDVGSHIAEIYNTSRRKAREMVDVEVDLAFMEGKSSLKAAVGDPTSSQPGKADSNVPAIRHSVADALVSSQSTLAERGQVKSCPLNVSASGPKQYDVSNGNTQPHVPLDLMSSCVATLLMLQRCTEQQYPPGEVTHLLDSAVTSLHPCCPENLSLYRDIEQCMGVIKTQFEAEIVQRKRSSALIMKIPG